MCPYDANKKELCPITMDNVRTRRVVDSLDSIINVCVTDEVRKTLWTTSLNNYRIAMVIYGSETISPMKRLQLIKTTMLISSTRHGLCCGRRRE